jgi:quinohemoprotein amine dehydrogenase
MPMFRVPTFRGSTLWLGIVIVGSLAGFVSGEEGIPVNDPLVIAKCGSCHARDARGNMERISWARTTPENWQDVLKQMILLNGLSVTPPEARSIVKYLSTDHGLAPEEARAVSYDPERRIHEETNIPNDTLRECARCHAFARPLSWRRSPEDWKQFADSHATRYKIAAAREAAAVTFLTQAAPLHTPEWDAWSAHPQTVNLAGRWLVAAYLPGRGNYYGEMRVDKTGDDEYSTRVNLKSVTDGSSILRTGSSAVFGGFQWRGRSRGNKPASSPDDLSSEVREVMAFGPDRSAAEGRWFWGQYQEFEFDVKLRRATSAATLLGVDRPSLKAGSQANRVRLTGDSFPGQITPPDLVFGPGITVRAIVSHSPSEIVAEVDVAADAALGRRAVAFRESVLPGAIAIYDRVDYVKVIPESAVAAFGDRTHQRGYQQFQAIGYQRGPDGVLHTDDDVALGPVDVAWSIQVFHAADGSSPDFVGTVSPAGLFAPAAENPNSNFDVWAIATATSEKGANGSPLVGKCYMVVTVPTYTFNGRQYVRDLDRWVDDGPASGRR